MFERSKGDLNSQLGLSCREQSNPRVAQRSGADLKSQMPQVSFSAPLLCQEENRLNPRVAAQRSGPNKPNAPGVSLLYAFCFLFTLYCLIKAKEISHRPLRKRQVRQIKQTLAGTYSCVFVTLAIWTQYQEVGNKRHSAVAVVGFNGLMCAAQITVGR